MAFTHDITDTLRINTTRAVAATFQKSAGAAVSVSESIPDESSDLEVAFTLDVTACQSFRMVADRHLTIETNDGTTPDDTISLVAGVPYRWFAGDYNAFLLGTDVTALFVTNASGEDATLEIEALYDPTP